MKIESLTDLFVEELRDLYDAETQLIAVLPQLAEAAYSEDVRDCFEQHAEETRIHIERLDSLFDQLNTSAQGRRSHGMAGLIEEARELLQNERDADPTVLDAALIVAAQKIEHYEIAGYGSARTFADTLGNHQAGQMLQQTLDEEDLTDRKLTDLAESHINLEAASGR
jgi:ferritin-like metal-binding protein YciE